MSSTNSSDNTEVAVIGTPSPTKHAQDAQGRPTIGKNFYINRGKEDEDEASTLSSISGGANISKAQFGDFPEQYDVESGVAVGNNTFDVIYGRENSYTDDKSSLSSLTDNYSSKGNWRKGALATLDGFQTQLDNIVDTSPSRETKNTNPWYVQSPQNVETIEIPNFGQGSDNTSSSSSINNIPEKELMTSFTRDHLDDLVRYPQPKPPPLQRLSSSFHRRASDLDSSRAGRSEGFLTYVQEQYILSRRKKLISGVIVVFFVCVIVIVVVAFNTQNNSNVNEEEANTIYQVEPPHEHDTLSSAGNSAFNESVLEDLSSVEHDDDTNDVSSGTSTTAAVILTTDPTEQISQVTESTTTTTTTTTATTSDTSSTSTDPTIPGWLNDLLALPSTATASTTTSSTTTTASTTTSQKTPTISPTYKPTFRPSISPSISSKESPTTAPALSLLSLKAISDTSIFKNRPTKNFASTSYLAVKNDAKASSFVRFDIPNTSGNTVSKAILRLFSILRVTDTDNDVIGGLSSISVDTLPLAGKWDESSITYNTQAELTDAFTVGSLSVEDYPYSESNGLQRVHELDVTAAFRNSADIEGFTTVSFMLYSDESSTGRVDFASSEGFNGPELVIELSDTTYPTKSPSIGSSTSTSSPVPSTMPSTTPINECIVKCEEDAMQKFDREIDKLVDKCIEESAFNENCQDEKKCKKECKKVAEKREDDVLKKVNNNAIKCKEICRNNAPNDTPLAVDRDVVVVVNNKLSKPSKQDKSAPDETDFRWMELFP